MITTSGLVLSHLKYQDHSIIVKILHPDFGIQSYMIRGAFAKKSKKSAYLFPLNSITYSYNPHAKGTLKIIQKMEQDIYRTALYTNPAKSSVVYFLADMLQNSALENIQHSALFHWLHDFLDHLASTHQHKQAVLEFLQQFSTYLGFFPHYETPLPYFDIWEGTGTETANDHTLSKSDSRLLYNSLHENNESISNQDYKKLVQIWLEYYMFHIDGFHRPKSLEVFISMNQ